MHDAIIRCHSLSIPLQVFWQYWMAATVLSNVTSCVVVSSSLPLSLMCLSRDRLSQRNKSRLNYRGLSLLMEKAGGKWLETLHPARGDWYLLFCAQMGWNIPPYNQEPRTDHLGHPPAPPLGFHLQCLLQPAPPCQQVSCQMGALCRVTLLPGSLVTHWRTKLHKFFTVGKKTFYFSTIFVMF